MYLGKYQGLLQLPDEELSRLSQRVTSPELSYMLRCEDLCEDFKEDLNFRFSLFGLRSLLVSCRNDQSFTSLSTFYTAEFPRHWLLDG